MPTVKDFNKKLNSLRNMRKVTNTVKMVSATKFHRAVEALRNARVFDEQFRGLMTRLSAGVDLVENPLLDPRKKPRNAMVIVISSDRGLCGSFNNNLHRMVAAWLAARTEQYEKIDLSCCSRRSNTFFRHRAHIRRYYEGVTAKPAFADASKIGKEMIALFLERRYDEVYIACNRFASPMSQKPEIELFLPIQPILQEGQSAPAAPEMLLEPPQKELLQILLPKAILLRFFFALLENAAGEHGARMTAMENATNNADDLIKSFTLLKNRARQAGITKELTEIVTGAEALK
jgi:F-type H+-transporting ATPase subunit gamma